MFGGVETRKVAVLGWYGHGNFGDALILDGLRHLFQGWETIPFSSTPNPSYPTFDYDAVNRCDLFVLGGGELICPDRVFFYSPLVRHSGIPAFVHRLLLNFDWVSRIKIPKVILGCGVNAEHAGQLKPHVIRILEKFSYIGLRDNASVEILRSFPTLRDKVHLFYDAALSIGTCGVTRQPSEGLAVVFPTDRNGLGVADKSAEWLREKLAPFKHTVFVPFGSEDNSDMETCRHLSRFVSSSDILESRQVSLANVLYLLSNCAKAFPYRLHGLILAWMAEADYEFYPYHLKVQRMHETLRGCDLRAVRALQNKTVNELRFLGGECTNE